jgi:hypothetical protein
MGTGYTRNDTANNIADGNIINAADLDGEFDAIEAAFATTGHTHDGTAAEGGAILVLGPTQEFVVSSTEAKPSSNAGLSLGTELLQFNNLYIDGNAYIDGLGESILVDTTSKIQFRDTALFINSSADGQLDLEADTTIELTAPTVSLTDNLKLKSDDAVLYFGDDDDISVTHVADTGLDLKNATGFNLNLQTGDVAVESGDLLGRITFNAPDETSGTSAILVGAAIDAVAEDTFASNNNSTALVFRTNTNGGATERMRLTSAGDLHFKDSRKAIFGDGSDLQIYHDGAASYIVDNGTGNLYMQGVIQVADSPDSNDGRILFGDATNAYGIVHYDYSAGDFLFENTWANAGADFVFRTNSVDTLTITPSAVNITGDLAVDTDTLFVDASDNITIAGYTQAPYSYNYGRGQFAVVSSNNYAGMSLSAHSDAAANGGYFGFTRSRGTLGTPSYVQAGDLIGVATAQPYRLISGNDRYIDSANMRFVASQNHSATQNGTDITFRSAEDGTVNLFERLSLESDLTVFNEDGRDVDFRVESDSIANLFVVNAGNNCVNINHNSATSNGIIDIRANANSSTYIPTGNGRLHVETTAGGGILTLIDSGTTNATTAAGWIDFSYATSFGGARTRMGYMGYASGSSTDMYLNNETPDGGLRVYSRKADDSGSVFNYYAGDTSNNFNEGSDDVDFLVRGTSLTHLLFVDAGNNRVSIGESTNAPNATLEIQGGVAMTAGWDRTLQVAGDSGSGFPVIVWNSQDVGYAGIGYDRTNTTSPMKFWTGATSSDVSGTGRRALELGIPNGQTVFNSENLDIDFRIESVDTANAFFLDADTGYIGVNEGVPSSHLDVKGSVRHKTLAPATTGGSGGANSNWYEIYRVDFQSSSFNTNQHYIRITGAGGTSGQHGSAILEVSFKQQAGSKYFNVFPLEMSGIEMGYTWDASGGVNSQGRMSIYARSIGGNYMYIQPFVTSRDSNPDEESIRGAFPMTNTGTNTKPTGLVDIYAPLYIQGQRYTTAGNVSNTFFVNRDGNDIDFRVSSNSNNEMLYVNAGTNLVGVSTSAKVADEKFRVNGSTVIGGTNGRYVTTLTSVFTAGQAKYLRIQQDSTVHGGITIIASGDYSNVNAMGCFKKTYAIGVNNSNTTLYTNASVTEVDLGSTSSKLSMGTASKPNNTTVYIPLTNLDQSYQITFTFTVEINGQINGISSVDIINQ